MLFAANGGFESRLPDCRIAAKVRFPEVKIFVPVNTFDTEPGADSLKRTLSNDAESILCLIYRR